MTAPVNGDLKFFKTAFSTIAAENGGFLSVNELITGVMNNVWEHVLSDDRATGLTTLRKLVLKIHQDDAGGYLASAKFGVEPTLGDDVVRMLAMTARNFEDDLTGAERHYCGGILVNPVVPSDTVLLVDVKHPDCKGDIQIGDPFRLTDKYDPGSSGNQIYRTVTDVSDPGGTRLNVTLDGAVGDNYAAYSEGVGGKVTSILVHGTIQAGFSNFVQSRPGGYDEAVYPLLFNNMGADEDDIALTFAEGGTNFTVVSARFGALVTGSKSGNYSPLHPTWNKILSTLEMAGWVGGVTHQVGDTVSWTTHAAAAYVGEKRIIPEGCSPLSNNRIILLHTSEGL